MPSSTAPTTSSQAFTVWMAGVYLPGHWNVVLASLPSPRGSSASMTRCVSGSCTFSSSMVSASLRKCDRTRWKRGKVDDVCLLNVYY